MPQVSEASGFRQSHHSVGTRNISPERKNYNPTQTTQHTRTGSDDPLGKFARLSRGERKRFQTTQEVLEDPFLPLRELKPTEWPVCCMGPAGRNRCRVKRRETHLKELQDPSSVAAGQSQEGKEHFLGSEGQVVKEQRGQAISAEEAARPSGA